MQFGMELLCGSLCTATDQQSWGSALVQKVGILPPPFPESPGSAATAVMLLVINLVSYRAEIER